MTQRKKLLERARRGADLTAEEFCTLARGFGIEVNPPRGGGSHYGLFLAEGGRIQTVKLPGSGPVKRFYIRRLVEIIAERWPE